METTNKTNRVENVLNNNGAKVESFKLSDFATVLISVAIDFEATVKASKQFDNMVNFGRKIGAPVTFNEHREDILRIMGSVKANSKHARTGSRASIVINFTEALKELRIPVEIKRVYKGEIQFIGTLLTLLNATAKEEELALKL